MCLALPAQITAVHKAWADVEIMGTSCNVNVQLIDNPRIGDYVLIHAGCAIQKINTDNFTYLQTVLEEFLNNDTENGC